MGMSYAKKTIITAVCIALCVVLPMAFHSTQNVGNAFMPMHIPVLLCGLICTWPFGLFCGLAGPLLSSLITGMPSMAILPSVMVELAAYGLISAVMMQIVRKGNVYFDMYISLTAALIAGRVLVGISRALFFSNGNYSIEAWTTGYFVTALPGLGIQLLLLPNIVFALEAAKLIPKRYPKKITQEEIQMLHHK